jgi:arsenate reductase
MAIEFADDRTMPLDLRIAREVQALASEFSGIFNYETIQRYIHESLDSLSNVRLTDYVHLFAGRFARDRLRALARTQGLMTKEVPQVLFLCTHNAGRSQMAAAFAAHLAGNSVTVLSAGSTPGEEVNQAAVQAMAEVGIDTSREFPKPMTDEVVGAADVVITMGCGDACPIYPGKRYQDWEVADPAGQSLEVVRSIRDDIRQRVEALLAELRVGSGVG